MATPELPGLALPEDPQASPQAAFSADGNHCLGLTQATGATSPSAVLFTLLNPTSPDRLAQDPIWKRCRQLTAAWGHGQCRAAFLFTACAAFPQDLAASGFPNDPQADTTLVAAARTAHAVVLAWGAPTPISQDPAFTARAHRVVRLLRKAGVSPQVLASSSGEPRSPLFVRPNASLQALPAHSSLLTVADRIDERFEAWA